MDRDKNSINRIRLEFKDYRMMIECCINLCINRIRLEFKGSPLVSRCGSIVRVLIESDWNLKVVQRDF